MEVSDASKNIIQDESLSNRNILLFKLVRLKSDQFSSVREYVTAMMTVAQQICNLGKDVDDELLATLMLQGLAEESQPMGFAIEEKNIQLTTDYVKSKLLQMEESYEEESRAVIEKQAENKQASRKKNKSSSVKCVICKGVHKERNCPKSPKNQINALMALSRASFRGPRYIENIDWVFDSGASTHMTNQREWLTNYKVLETQVEIACANGNKLFGVGLGDVINEQMGMTISNVVYVPGLSANLISVNSIVNRNLVVIFRKKGILIMKEDGFKVSGEVSYAEPVHNGVFKIRHSLKKETSTVSETMELWHKRMGHLGIANLKLLKDKMALGINFLNSASDIICHKCLKQKKLVLKKDVASRAKEILELVHMDIYDMSEISFEGYRYFLTFIDDYTRKTFVYFLKNKSGVFEKFVEFVKLAERQTVYKVKNIKSDYVKEFANRRMEKFCKSKGISRQVTTEYTIDQNEVAERANKVITEKAKIMLEEAGLDGKLWAEAVNTAVYLKNRSPTVAVKNKTPEEAWTGRKVDLSSIRVFGCKVYLDIPNQNCTKRERKSNQLVHVGYCEDSKRYRLVNPATGQLFKASNVIFLENKKYGKKKETTQDRSDVGIEALRENEMIEDEGWVTFNDREESDENDFLQYRTSGMCCL